jgi:simple sugar transport system permease protein
VPGLLRAWRGVPEVIVTILLNFVALEAVSWLVQGPMREEAGRYPQSDPIAAAAALPTWGRVPAALLLALALALLLQLWLGRTRAGLTVRVAGASPRAARVAGMPVRALTAWVFVLSGALAGLGGAAEMQGPVQRLYEGYAPGYGFSAIAVALLARLEPLLVAPAALLFGALAAGSERMEALAGVPAVVGQVVQALVVLGSVLAWRREEP